MFDITFQASEKASSRGLVYRSYTLESLARTTCKPLKGPKNGQGFIRGALTADESENTGKRCDENLEYSKLLVIDGDSGINGQPTPSAECCHDALCTLGYNHVLYTTHSHIDSHHKYRAVVELSEQIEAHELSINMDRLLDELKAHGCYLNPVKEMYAWSQIWYLPRRLDPDDGQFIQLTFFSGSLFNTIHCGKRMFEDNEPKHQENADTETLEQMYNNIATGAEFHQSMNNIIIQQVRDGVSRAMILANMRALMNASKVAGTERWLERYNDIERSVDGAFKRVEEEKNTLNYADIIDFDDTRNYTRPMPLPPGRTGRLISLMYKGMQRQSIEIAHISVFGLLAAICGAKFNVVSNGCTGLNLSYILAAPTGSGKSQIRKFIEHVIKDCMRGKIVSLSDSYESFMSDGSVTTPRAIFRHASLARSFISIMNEAGLNLGEKSGSPEATMAYILELYTSSGHESYTDTKAYADEKDSIKSLRGISASFIYESVETSLGKVVQNTRAVESGFIPRNDVITVLNRPNINRNKILNPYKFIDEDDDIVKQFDSILRVASEVQSSKTYKPVLVTMTDKLSDEYFDIDDYYNNEFKGQGYIDDIATRISMKILKISSLVTVFNDWTTESEINISLDAWEYAKDFYSWYMENLHIIMSFYETSNPFDEAILIMKKAIINAANKLKMSIDENKEIRISNIKDALNKNNGAMLRRLSDASKAMNKGTDDTIFSLLKIMERNGQLVIYDKHGKCKVPCIILLIGFQS